MYNAEEWWAFVGQISVDGAVKYQLAIFQVSSKLSKESYYV